MALTKSDLKKELVAYKRHLAHEITQNRGGLLKLKLHDEVEATFKEIQNSLSRLILKL